MKINKKLCVIFSLVAFASLMTNFILPLCMCFIRLAVILLYFALVKLTFPDLAAVVSKISPLGSFVLNLNEIMLCLPVSQGGNI